MTRPANTLTERRIPPRVRSSRFSTLAAATDKITISRNVLFGLCLTTFACGIVTTLAIDHMHARASEAAATREPEPVVLQTTPIERVTKPAVAAAIPSPTPPSSLSSPSLPSSSLPSPSLPSSPPPSSLPPSSPAVVMPQAAAADAVVVQLPPLAEKSAEKSAGKLFAHQPPPPASRGVRPSAAAPVRTIPTAPHKRTGATAQSDSSSSGTETAPEEEQALPAPTKKQWVDPFAQ